jgi:hypothetical protein
VAINCTVVKPAMVNVGQVDHHPIIDRQSFSIGVWRLVG